MIPVNVRLNATAGALSPLRLLRILDAPSTRSTAVSVVIVAAVLSPDIGLPGGLPAIRLEQILMVLLVPAMLRIHLRERALRRWDLVDLAFVTVVVSVTISIVLAPVIVPTVGRSYRDVFQILRPLEYWILYRLGRVTWAERPFGIGRLFVAFAVLNGSLGILQAVGGSAFNATITAIWANSNAVLGAAAQRRIVGTIGNANLFGLWSGWLALAAVAGVFGRDRIDRRALYLIALGLSAMTLVLSQSRSAGLGTFGAAGLMGLALLARARLEGVLKRDLRRLAVAAAAVAAGAAVALSVLVAPGGTGSSRTVARFDVTKLATDASVVERLAILHFAFGEHDPNALHALICDRAPIGSVPPGHQPGGSAPSPVPVPAMTRAALEAARSAEAGYCATGTWTLPVTTTPPIAITPDVGGYTLEAPVDPSGPELVLTSHPNLILEPSLETWPPAQWHVTPNSTLRSGPGRYGARSAEVDLARSGVFDQYVLYTFARDSPYTGSIEARSADGAQHTIVLSVEEWLTDGKVISGIGHGAATLPADGSWVRAIATFRTPPTGEVWVMRVLVTAPGASGTIAIDLDGATLVAGAAAPTFEYLRDIDPAVLPSDLPSFWESPVVGVGPMSNIPFGSLDNEYALTLLRFGVLGLAALLALYLALIVTGIRAWLRQPRGASGLSGLALAAAVVAAMAYGIAAGVWYSYQLTAILMLWAGVVGVSALGAGAPGNSGNDTDIDIDPGLG